MENLDTYIAKINRTIKPIPTNFKRILANLKSAEGNKLHFNSNEEDITTGYGIYRKVNPNAEVFKYIDLIAAAFTPVKSNMWSNDTIAKINFKIDSKIEEYLTYLFYMDYFSGAMLDLFNDDLATLMANLYANSKKGAWMSVQEGLIDMQKFGLLEVNPSDLSIVDGSFGNKTKNALLLLKYKDSKTQLIFKVSIILAMKTYYIKLGSENPEKFLRYLNGWNNRMETLQHQ